MPKDYILALAFILLAGVAVYKDHFWIALISIIVAVGCAA